MNRFTLIYSFFCISSCSSNQISMKAEDCLKINWASLGQIEGSKGLSVEMFNYHLQRCPSKAEAKARSQYLQGHRLGTPLYCNYATGFIKGEVSDPVPKLCRNSGYKEFHKGYQDGVRSLSQ